MKVSGCLILKDEGTTIRRCLDSMVDIVDEWIIGIDSESKDETLDEVLKFFKEQFDIERHEIQRGKKQFYIVSENVKVYKYMWEQSFSKARNEGMDMASGDYILIMDGHEFFPEEWYNITGMKRVRVQDELKANLKNALEAEKPDTVFFNLYQQPFQMNMPNNYFMQPRVYRNDPKIRFNRAAHNTIVNTDRTKDLNVPDVIIIHAAPKDNRAVRSKQRIEMNTKALEADIKKNPKDLRALFYLGNTLLEAKRYKKAISCYKKYVKGVKGSNEEKYQTYIHMGLAYRALKDWDNCRDAFFLAKACDQFRRDAYLLMGDVYTELGHVDLAISEYINGLNLRPQPSRMFQNGANSTYDPHQKLAMLYDKKGNRGKAVYHLKAALSFMPYEGWIGQLKEWTSGKTQVLLIDGIGSFTGDFCKYLESDPSIELVKSSRYDERLAAWASVIWCEWGDENAFLCSKGYPEKTVIRIHGYEAYVNQHILQRVDWERIRKVVFVAEHIKNMVLNVAPIPEAKCLTIPPGVNTGLFEITQSERSGRKVGYAGFINEKKNPWLLIQTIKRNPKVEFHLRIDHQSPFWAKVFARELENCENAIYHQRYKNLADFWNQMDGVISTSIIESFSYNIAEAMACGCRPYIYNWEGADKTWRIDDIQKDGEFLRLGSVKGSQVTDKEMIPLEPLTEDEMKKNRQYIIDNYDNRTILPVMKTVLLGQ